MKGTYAGNRLKKFVERDRYFQASDEIVEKTSRQEAQVAIQGDVDAALEEGGAIEMTEENLNIDKKSEIEVRVPGLSEVERRKYVRIPDEWDKEDDD
jgi:hypothetical protein